MKEFDAFLQEYGWRSDRVVDVSSPAWVEDPDRCLGIIRSLLQSNDPYAFEHSLKSAETVLANENVIAAYLGEGLT